MSFAARACRLAASGLRRRAFASSASAPAAGTLYMCGTGESNKLGLGDTKDRETPTIVEGLQAFYDAVAMLFASGKCGGVRVTALRPGGAPRAA